MCGSHPAPAGGVEDEIEMTWSRLAQINDYLDEIKMDV